jgi:hypothetical protein
MVITTTDDHGLTAMRANPEATLDPKRKASGLAKIDPFLLARNDPD